MAQLHPFTVVSLPNGGRFLFTSCPGTQEASMGDALQTFVKAGASVVVTVLPDEEMASLQVPELGQQVVTNGLQWFQLPVKDNAKPDQAFLALLSGVKSTLISHIQQRETIVIHCRGGSGRTGLIAAVLLLECGYHWDQVKALVQSARPKALTLPQHLNFLNEQYQVGKYAY
ncbi:phosphatase family protein, putative [Methylophaga frappieri]|uniref:protein-tyrosine-phosphatase n=2 Tax=Methylophaga frappieri (strain ATCC BAA-2434 / DSM 25690 / JAM7) TaxID=754477 RepID=I1YK00_METFJ|nr:phosphatase family protein, putative [Methylophaga frappieri]